MTILKFPNRFESASRKHEFEFHNKVFVINRPSVNETIVKVRRNNMVKSAKSKYMLFILILLYSNTSFADKAQVGASLEARQSFEISTEKEQSEEIFIEIEDNTTTYIVL